MTGAKLPVLQPREREQEKPAIGSADAVREAVENYENAKLVLEESKIRYEAAQSSLDECRLALRDAALAVISCQHINLSVRQREVLNFLQDRKTNKEIAATLHISERTAKFHVSALLQKYGFYRRDQFFGVLR
ncbi:MAG TPA: helix-turn-helix transcriptional regulator [Candidatus Binatia bacterium]|nr:helix-turn-helix transcriptional regulator [Candidatus Binatia bacterium]